MQLIIGGDSLIGSGLASYFQKNRIPFIATTRKKVAGKLFLDLNNEIDYSSLPPASHVYLCAGINGYDSCNQNPSLARYINLTATLKISNWYLEKYAAHIVFLSSTAVFQAQSPSPDESTNPNPSSLYGTIKRDTELSLLDAGNKYSQGKVSIARLTKVLSSRSPIIEKWLIQAQNFNEIEALNDLFISPVSLEYAIRALFEIGKNESSGIFHLSGESIISYASLAKKMCFAINSSSKIIESNMPFDIRKSHEENCYFLSMKKSTESLKIDPQRVDSVVRDLISRKI